MLDFNEKKFLSDDLYINIIIKIWNIIIKLSVTVRHKNKQKTMVLHINLISYELNLSVSNYMF